MVHQGLATDVFSYESSRYPELDIKIEPTLWQRPEDLATALSGVEAWIVRNMTKVTPELLAAAPNLKVIGRLGVGLDNVDLEAAKAAGVTVVYSPQANAPSVAEYCLGQLLNLFRNLVRADVSTRAGRWDRSEFVGREIEGSTIGVIGYGNSGAAFSKICTALGARVLVHTRRPHTVCAPREVAALDDLLRACDAVSLHLPLTPQTEGLVDETFLARMKTGSVLINASRGEVVKEADLVHALKSGELAGAALDVRRQEPPETGTLETLSQAVLSPHIAAFTQQAQDRVTKTVIDDVIAVLKGETPTCPAF